METELTTQIKKATHSYAPQMSNMRTIRYADEVTTPSGVVGSIRFEDIDVGEVDCKRPPCRWPDREAKGCVGCIYRKHKVVTEMMITCYEVKITMADFRSSHGHNFWGNKNYYCVPKEMAPLVVKELGKDWHVGVLSWDGNHLRMYKTAEYIEISDQVKIMLLYNALKKWCDGVQTIN